jgi:hypothetical protein
MPLDLRAGIASNAATFDTAQVLCGPDTRAYNVAVDPNHMLVIYQDGVRRHGWICGREGRCTGDTDCSG